jgi:SOS-response transcriptional repressor LexA
MKVTIARQTAGSLDQDGRAQLGEILKRIDRRLQRLELTDRGASILAGLSASQIRTMRRQYRDGLQHGASIRTIAKLARALRTSPQWLLSGTGVEEPAEIGGLPDAYPEAGLRLAGAVGAGLWIEAAPDATERPLVQVPPDPRYPVNYQFAFEVRGTSINRFARPGDFLVVVDREAAGLAARSGDIVIVTRSMRGLKEVTARRLRGNPPNCELQYESTDPNYNGPALRLGSDQQVNGGDADIAIVGIAVAVYRPLT